MTFYCLDIAEMSPPTGCRVDFKNPDDIMNFTLYITPNDGMYIGATFQFSITIPNTYPYDAPKVHCDTLVYHPNIDLEGHVCLNILRQDWMPVLSLGSVIFGLMTLFLEPNPGLSLLYSSIHFTTEQIISYFFFTISCCDHIH